MVIRARAPTVFAIELDGRLRKVVGNAVLGQQCFESLILLLDLVAFASRLGVHLFEAEYFLLESLDVLFLSFTVCTSDVSAKSMQRLNRHSPLRLSVQLLSPCHGGLAVGLRPSAFRRLAICLCVSL